MEPDKSISRRQAIGALTGIVLGGLTLTTLAACSDQKSETSSTTSASTTGSECLNPPEETAGPYPADGSNRGTNVLDLDGIVRSDIRSNLGGSNTQQGIPFDLRVTISDDSCSPIEGAAMYLWHCNDEGEYSVYGEFDDDSFLRGVQISDSKGQVSFTTIVPGRYTGRATHFHFAIFKVGDYQSGNADLTSQFAFDDEEIDALYKSFDADSQNLRNPTYNDNDNVFSDGYENQLLNISGSVQSSVAGQISITV